MEALSTANYTIKGAERSQLPEILSFLLENFDKEETMMKSLRANNVISEEENECMKMDHVTIIKAVFQSSPCLVAVHNDSKKIIGVNLMILSQNPKNGESDGVVAMFKENAPKTRLGREYFEYLSEIGEKADLYEKFPRAKAALEFYAVAVDRNHRGKGIAKMLMMEGISYAKSLGNIGFVFGVYTSVYSKKAAERLGLKSVLDVDLLTLKDKNGCPVFQDTPPHNIVSVLVLEI